MTNPNNMVRVRARNGGRASIYEACEWAQTEMPGIMHGKGVTENTTADMNVLVGGSASDPEILIALAPSGYKIPLDLESQQAIALTNPATNKRISAIVAYTDDLSQPTTEDTVTGSPASCGLIVVNGAIAASPLPPTDSDIRAAITADGASGAQAAYCTIAVVTVSSDTSVITNSLIRNHFGKGVRGFGKKELLVYVDAVNGDDAFDGFSQSTPMKTIEGAFDMFASSGAGELKLRLSAGSTYSIDGYILNNVSIHFQPYGSGTTNLSITTNGSNYSFAFYNSHVNFTGSASLPLVVNMANTTTADSSFYLDSGNMQASYTTFNCGVTLWSAGARFQHCTLNRKLRVMMCNIIEEQSTISALEASASNLSLWQTTIDTSSSDNKDNYYWNIGASVVSITGSSSATIDSVPSVANFLYAGGTTFYIGAVVNKNNSSTKKFSGNNILNGCVIIALQNRYDAIKAMATTTTVSSESIKTSGLTL